MSSGRPIDHLVLAVPNLDEAVDHYTRLGFTPTPRARHDDHMGTSNHLLQFHHRNFIELLQVDRPETLDEHALDAEPPRFSFGAHNRAYVKKRRSGVSMIVFATDDARADIEAFRDRGLQTYAPFDFERQAKKPDGTEVTVAFSLGFVTDAAMGDTAFFVCQQRAPQHFWKPAYQEHANGALGIATVYMAADDPGAHGAFLGNLFDGEVTSVEAGISIACGPHQKIVVLTPAGIRDIAPATPTPTSGPMVVGIALASQHPAAEVVSSDDGCGMFIQWVSA